MSDTGRVCNTGFFPALKGCFTGTEVFGRLRFQSVSRTVFHLLFYCVLLAAWTAAAQYFRCAGAFDSAAEVLEREFGAIRFSPDGATPGIDPERGRAVMLYDRACLLYLPAGAKVPEVPPDAGTLVAWLPKQFLFGRRSSGGNWLIGFPEFHELDKGELGAFLEAQSGRAALRFPEQTIPARELMESLKAGFLLGAGAMFALRYLGMSLLLSTMFCAFFSWTRRGNGISFREAWVMCVYAGMPGLFVGSFFPAFDLPLLSDNLVYVLALVIYFPLIAAKEERSNE